MVNRRAFLGWFGFVGVGVGALKNHKPGHRPPTTTTTTTLPPTGGGLFTNLFHDLF